MRIKELVHRKNVEVFRKESGSFDLELTLEKPGELKKENLVLYQRRCS
jgi:hypothetical protein